MRITLIKNVLYALVYRGMFGTTGHHRLCESLLGFYVFHGRDRPDPKTITVYRRWVVIIAEFLVRYVSLRLLCS